MEYNAYVNTKKQTGRPQRRFVDIVEEDKQTISVTKQEARDKLRWKQMICSD